MTREAAVQVAKRVSHALTAPVQMYQQARQALCLKLTLSREDLLMLASVSSLGGMAVAAVGSNRARTDTPPRRRSG